MMLEALLLGRTVFRVDAVEVIPSTRKALAAVAYLALVGPVDRGRLAGLLWPELHEPEARRNLRRELHRLRETPLGDFLSGGRERLVLDGPIETDVARFRRAAADGRLEEAEGHYRGALLDGLELADAEGFQAWLVAEREALARERSAVVAQLAVRREREGDLRGALGSRLALLRDDELQEVHQREVMRLHALLGEREAALARFERFRQLLRDELALEPLPETTSLADRVRAAQAPAPDTLALAGATARELRPPLVGREVALSRLERTGTPLALILGEPGVGKTRLAEDYARARGCAVVLRGREASTGTPFYPVAEALRAAGSAALELLEPIWLREVARLAPDLAPLEAVAATGQPAPEGRAHFLEGLARALAVAAGAGGTVILEDLHWFDAASAELSAHLARRVTLLDPGLRILGTARSPELIDNSPAASIVSVLEHEKLLHRVELDPLGESGVLELVRALSGNRDAALFSRRLFEATAGNPLFVLETLRSLLESGELRAPPGGPWSTPYDDTTADYRELPLPSSVRDAVLLRVDRLGPATRRLLEAASLAGDGFAAEHLAGTTALAEWEALDSLERALGARLLEASPAGYRFGHELVRRALDSSLGDERRRLVHRKLAASLEGLGGDPSSIAGHLEQAGHATETVTWRLRAADAASRVFAFSNVIGHLSAALEAGAAGRDAFRARAGLTEARAALSDAAGRANELEAMSALAAELGDPLLETEAALARIAFANESGRSTDALEEADRLLGRPDLTPAQASRTLHLAGLAGLRLGRLPEAEAHLNAALQRDPAASRSARGDVRNALCSCAMQRGDYEVAGKLNDEALADFQADGNRAGQSRARMTAGVLSGVAGDRQAALGMLERALAEARDIGHVVYQRAMLLNLSKLHLDADEAEQALPWLEQGLALAREPQDPFYEGIFLSQLGHANRLLGNLGAAVTNLERAVALADRTGAAQQAAQRRLILADLRRDVGDLAGAGGLLADAAAPIEAGGSRQLAFWLEFQRSAIELASGDPTGALARLAAAAAESPIQPEDRAQVAWLTAAARLALGDAVSALNEVSPRDASPAQRARALAVQLDARLRAGKAGGNDWHEAQALLLTGGVPPLETLELLESLTRAVGAVGEPGRALKWREQGCALLTRLASTLDAHPELRASLIASHRALVSTMA